MSSKASQPAVGASIEALPHFEHPPVIEVVCGVTFRDLPGLLSPYLGRLWERYRSEYPHCQEVPPLAPAIERFAQPDHLEIAFEAVPPMARVWFVHAKENGIIQVQRDRFLHNWKKVEPTDEYPRYERVIEMFRARLETFEAFLGEESLGGLDPVQYEMTYVNHVPFGTEWKSLADISSVLPDFSWRADPGRFLPTPELLNWRTSFLLPDDNGRLHVAVRTGRRASDQQPVLILDLTARGFPRDATRQAMWNWFSLAHEWIVRGFTDLTGDRMHSAAWERVR